VVLPLVAVAARIAARQAAKQAAKKGVRRGLRGQLQGGGAPPPQEEESDFPWAEWALLTVFAMLVDAVVIVLRPLDFLIGLGTLIATPLNAIAMILCTGWAMMRLGKGKPLWKRLPKKRLIAGGITSNIPFNFIPTWTVYMMSLLFFR